MNLHRFRRVIRIICVEESHIFSIWRDDWSIERLKVSLIVFSIEFSHSINFFKVHILILDLFFTSVKNLNGELFDHEVVPYFEEVLWVVREEESLFVVSIVQLILSWVDWRSHEDVPVVVVIVLVVAEENKVFRHTWESLLISEVEALVSYLRLENLFVSPFLSFFN